MGKDGEPLKKQLSALLALCLGTLCVLSSLAWRRAERQAAEWKTRAEAAERRAIQAETAQEDSEAQRRLLSLEDDPIAAFFSPFPYSGATARYLATLETNAYRTELENAAELLGNNNDGVPVDAFLTFIDAQAQSEADAWTASLEAQGAMTAGAWAHVDQCQTAIYRFGAYTLISAYQRTGESYSFLFSSADTRQTLLEAGFQEEYLPPDEQINK